MAPILAADLALTVLEKLMPHIIAAINRGEIPAADQVALMQRIKNLRPENGGFSGPEWKQSTDTAPSQ
jgi:hypothetical protein